MNVNDKVTLSSTQKNIRYILMLPAAIISVFIATRLCFFIFNLVFDVHKNAMFLPQALYWTISGFVTGLIFSTVLTTIAPNYKKHILLCFSILWFFLWIYSITVTDEDYWKVYSTVLFYVGILVTYKNLKFVK